MRTLVASTLASVVIGCAPEFDSQSEVKSLRVFAVQKDTPYARPGQDVTLRMLWHDGTDEAPRPMQVAWIAGCFNPPGDLYAGCFETFRDVELDTGDRAPCGPDAGVGPNSGNETFTLRIPDSIISERPAPFDPRQPPYGVAVVFFAVCAGQLGPAPAAELDEFPIACYDCSGKRLGPEHFVAGYSTLYVYERLSNANPIITGFEFNDTKIVPRCTGPACLDEISAEPRPVDCATNDTPCVPACPEDGEPDCPKFPIKPVIDRKSAEKDDTASAVGGVELGEQMWITYYADKGSVESEVRLLNDAIKGWQEDHGTDFRAPKESGPMNLWAIVRDNRGGVDWTRIQVQVNAQ